MSLIASRQDSDAATPVSFSSPNFHLSVADSKHITDASFADIMSKIEPGERNHNAMRGGGEAKEGREDSSDGSVLVTGANLATLLTDIEAKLTTTATPLESPPCKDFPTTQANLSPAIAPSATANTVTTSKTEEKEIAAGATSVAETTGTTPTSTTTTTATATATTTTATATATATTATTATAATATFTSTTTTSNSLPPSPALSMPYASGNTSKAINSVHVNDENIALLLDGIDPNLEHVSVPDSGIVVTGDNLAAFLENDSGAQYSLMTSAMPTAATTAATTADGAADGAAAAAATAAAINGSSIDVGTTIPVSSLDDFSSTFIDDAIMTEMGAAANNAGKGAQNYVPHTAAANKAFAPVALNMDNLQDYLGNTTEFPSTHNTKVSGPRVQILSATPTIQNDPGLQHSNDFTTAAAPISTPSTHATTTTAASDPDDSTNSVNLASIDESRKSCSNCNETTVKYRCSRCKSRGYCGKACQTAAWPTHRLECKEIALKAKNKREKERRAKYAASAAEFAAKLSPEDRKWKAWRGGNGQPVTVNEENLSRYVAPEDSQPYDPPATMTPRTTAPHCNVLALIPAIGVPHAPNTIASHSQTTTKQSTTVLQATTHNDVIPHMGDDSQHWDCVAGSVDTLQEGMGGRYAAWSWHQSTTEVEVRLIVPQKTRGRDVTVRFTPEHLYVSVKLSSAQQEQQQQLLSSTSTKSNSVDNVLSSESSNIATKANKGTISTVCTTTATAEASPSGRSSLQLVNHTLSDRIYVGGNSDDRGCYWTLEDGCLLKLHMTKWRRQSVACVDASYTWWRTVFKAGCETMPRLKAPPQAYYNSRDREAS